MPPVKPGIFLAMCDRRLRDILAERFSIEGWRSQGGDSFLDIERKAARFRPTVIVIDTQCVSSVTDTIKRARSLPTLLKAHILIYAPSMTREQIDATLAAGAQSVLLAPHIAAKDVINAAKDLLKPGRV